MGLIDCYLMVNIIKTKTMTLDCLFSLYPESDDIRSICKHIPFDDNYDNYDDDYFYSYSILKAVKYIRSKINDPINIYVYTDKKIKLNSVIIAQNKYSRLLKKTLDNDDINIIFTPLDKDDDKIIVEKLEKIFMKRTKDYTLRYDNKKKK